MARQGVRRLAPSGGYPDPVTQTSAAPISIPDRSDGGATATPPLRLAPRVVRRRGRVASYVALTKPRIIELLLVTTLPSMVLAAGGMPGWWVVAATMVGGTLAAGSA